MKIFMAPELDGSITIRFVTVKFMSKDKFNASLKRVQKKHAKNIQALADR